ncbi:MAG: hypothetical protein SF162_03735 [bacterium]|nr:hypothetical protein [bacterium]
MTDHSQRDDRTPDPMRSPVRPTPPQPSSGTSQTPRPAPTVPNAASSGESVSHDPAAALNAIRSKMELVSDEFAQGKINSVQFHVMYRRYSEQRTIIEKLIERDPEGDAWQRVMSVKGQTGFLRSQYEAQALCYAIFRAGSAKPILTGGKAPADEPMLAAMAAKLWQLPKRPNPGLARKALPTSHWIIVATGDHAATFAVFSIEPSNAQARLVRDLHADFERANAAAFARDQIVPERMVFPQRALGQGTL